MERQQYEVPCILYVPASCRDAAYHAVKEALAALSSRLDNDVYLVDIDYRGVKEVGAD